MGKITALLSNVSVRTLILGIDETGRVIQHDRNAPEILPLDSAELVGAHLSDLVATPSTADAALTTLLDAVRAGREATAVLPIGTREGRRVETVASVQPMLGETPGLAALAVLKMPPTQHERFVDPALMRHSLLDDTFRQIGATLDLDQVARGLINILVPHFCTAAGLLVLESVAAGDEFPVNPPDGSQLLRRLAVATDDGSPGWDATFPTGEVLLYPPGTPYVECMDTGKPVRVTMMNHQAAVSIAESWLRRPVADLLSEASMLLLPLATRDACLGFFVCTRKSGYRPFDDYDSEIGMEFASRAGIFIDNARQYNRERTTALTLQRSLLPTGLSHPSSVDVQHRYLPGSKLIEVGGDWYESIALPGARVALVVGDVAGHGVRAAVTMGRLRTAIHTLATLELPPADSLQQLNELMTSLGEREPHFATCAYALYDAVTGSCEMASAGHLPPLLVRPDGTGEFLDTSPAPPLGVGEFPIESRTFQIEDGSLLVLYTDGLVEDRQRDIDDGLNFLRDVFDGEAAKSSLDDLCRAALAGVYAHQQRDDIAILIARLSKIPADHHVTWTLPAELTSAAEARSLIREPLQRWGLTELVPTTELLVSELVTNAIRHATGEVTLRMVLEGTLVCEVLDGSAALPRLRHAGRDEECGRGLEVVSQLSQRWGARRTPQGKIVWCEQALPPAPAGSPPKRRRRTAPGSLPGETTSGRPRAARPGTDGEAPGETAETPSDDGPAGPRLTDGPGRTAATSRAGSGRGAPGVLPDRQLPVLHDPDPLGAAGHGAVVGHQDEREPGVAPQLLQQAHDVVPGALVQVAGRLVGQQHLGLLDQRAGDRHPLLLASGHLSGQVPQPLAETHILQRRRGAGPPLRRPDAQRHQGHLHVLQRVQRRDQVEGLEDEPHRRRPDLRDLGFPQGGEVLAVEFHDARGRPVQAAEDLQQGGLAVPGRALDGQPLTVLDDQVHAGQRIDRGPALLVLLGHARQLVHVFLSGSLG